MDFLLKLLDKYTVIEITFFLVVSIYLAYRGIIKLPFVNKKTVRKHKTCSLYDDHKNLIKIAVLDALERGNKIWNIKTKETLYEQMSMMETKQDLVLTIMRDAFKSINNNCRDIKHYDTLLKTAERDIKNIIRKWFKENHYADKSEIEFENYIDEHIQLILEKVGYILDVNFLSNHFEISREELKKINDELSVPKIARIYRNMFLKARHISIEKMEQVNGI